MENLSLIKLNEMNEDLSKAIDNITVIVRQQKKLINLILEDNEGEEFKDFIKSLEDSNLNYTDQLVKLNEKKVLVEELIEEISNNEDYKGLIDKLFNVLGIK